MQNERENMMCPKYTSRLTEQNRFRSSEIMSTQRGYLGHHHTNNNRKEHSRVAVWKRGEDILKCMSVSSLHSLLWLMRETSGEVSDLFPWQLHKRNISFSLAWKKQDRKRLECCKGLWDCISYLPKPFQTPPPEILQRSNSINHLLDIQ